MSSDKLDLLKEQFIDRLLEDLKDPELDTRKYETIRAFLKDWKSDLSDIPSVSLKDSVGPAPFKIG